MKEAEKYLKMTGALHQPKIKKKKQSPQMPFSPGRLRKSRVID
jgi:hypothetical protein